MLIENTSAVPLLFGELNSGLLRVFESRLDILFMNNYYVFILFGLISVRWWGTHTFLQTRLLDYVGGTLLLSL
jgi:hypothetical protein